MSYFSRFIHHTEVMGGVGLDWGNWIVVAIRNMLQTGVFFFFQESDVEIRLDWSN